MKIYTTKGDKGNTQLLGGSIIKKNHIKLECYGTIDELNAFIGNIYDEEINPLHKAILLKIQNQLFNLGSCIAFDGKKRGLILTDITHKNIDMLEKEIDKMDGSLPLLTNFILPSGLSTVSKCHIARTVCRRAERNLVSLEEIEKINPLHLKYLNRLSDYLFTLARFILNENNIAHVEWQKD
ncbi:MAG: cob(I)yrinic acid a,c-diamide adenosyltransferase [Bacteroidota bacterium]|nr:cob(I)yrinic acid a,c-diamide adenosyltransferase [Bacteroidota bacterium]|tara:strand:+ start:117 stop:662 length:546 start_codon:yes stop_codon:yes gene_type:complete